MKKDISNNLELEWRNNLSDKTVGSLFYFCNESSNVPSGETFLTQKEYKPSFFSFLSSKTVKCSKPNFYYRHQYETTDGTIIKEIGVAVSDFILE